MEFIAHGRGETVDTKLVHGESLKKLLSIQTALNSRHLHLRLKTRFKPFKTQIKNRQR